MRRHRLASSLRVLEYALVLIAGLAFGWYAGVKAASARDQASWAQELERQSAAVSVSGVRAADVRPAPAHRSLIGRLEVPRLGLSAIAREGVDARTLRSAVGHVPDTALPGARGNAAFAAHRDTFFRKLKDVRTGDRIHVKTVDGEFTYEVRETRVVAPNDVSVLEPTAEPVLTLVTCYPFDYIGSAPKRFIVRAVRKGEG